MKKLLILFALLTVFGCSEDDDKNSNTPDTGSPAGEDTFTDPRDGQVYPLVTIGNQVWFAKNLNYDAAGSWCYDDNAGNCNTYGRLYDWEAALTACPEGTHLPSDAEWTQLTDYLGGDDVAGGKMRSTTGWYTNFGGTNSSGFTGLPGGIRYTCCGYYDVGNYGDWWSATASSASDAWGRSLSYNVDRYYYDKTDGLSCRCLRD